MKKEKKSWIYEDYTITRGFFLMLYLILLFNLLYVGYIHFIYIDNANDLLNCELEKVHLNWELEEQDTNILYSNKGVINGDKLEIKLTNETKEGFEIYSNNEKIEIYCDSQDEIRWCNSSIGGLIINITKIKEGVDKNEIN